jgi:hypothetical protein
MGSIESTSISPSSMRYRPPTLTCGRVQIRTLQVISPRRTPSRSRLVNVMMTVYPGAKAIIGVDDGPAFLRPSGPNRPTGALRGSVLLIFNRIVDDLLRWVLSWAWRQRTWRSGSERWRGRTQRKWASGKIVQRRDRVQACEYAVTACEYALPIWLPHRPKAGCRKDPRDRPSWAPCSSKARIAWDMQGGGPQRLQ